MESDSQKLSFGGDNGPVDQSIQRLIDLCGGIQRSGYVREMILSALKAGQEDIGDGDLKLMNTALKEMRFTAKVFGAYRHVRKVSVFGSARTRPDDPIYQMARRFGEKLAAAGFMVITGGGPGIMQAVNEGAGSERSFGVSIRLPHEQSPNPVLKDSPRVITYKYFFSRKVAFLKEAHAVALFPGGFGTLDEALEALTLVQTGKHDPVPIVLLEPPGGTYWLHFLEFIGKQLIPGGYIGARDLTLLERFESPEAAVARIAGFYRRYHSMRYAGDRLVIRLTTALTIGQVDTLSDRFRDILGGSEGIRFSKTGTSDTDTPETENLPRLVFQFNRKDHSRLCRLIDAINAF